MQQARAYIGTSGWNYRDWKEILYPRGLRQSDWLHHFAREFDTVEINNTFYRIPQPEMVQRWSEQTPRRFRFAVKLWRGITQFKKLADCREQLESFFQAVGFPTSQRGPLLVQLPPSQGCDVDKLNAFLDDVREITAPARWKVAVEFRNDSWLCDTVYQLLDRHRAAVCLHDMPRRAPVEEPNDASFVYVRRHGATGKYRGCYAEKHIAADANRVRRWLREGRTVFVYYNNDVEGHAVENARQLQEAAAS